MSADEGWAPMHSTQRAFHYYRRDSVGVLRAMCGKWAIPKRDEAHLPLLKTDPANAGPEDCVGCGTKLRAVAS